MIALGLILMLLMALFGVAVMFSNPAASTLSLFGMVQIPTTAAGVFLTGAATMLVFAFGFSLLRAGGRRSRARSRQLKTLKRENQQQSIGTPAAAVAPRSTRTAETTPPVSRASVSEPAANPPAAPATPAATERSRASDEVSSDGPAAPIAPSATQRSRASDEVSSDAPAARDTPAAKPPVTDPPGSTTAAERQRMLDEVDDVTGDDPPPRAR